MSMPADPGSGLWRPGPDDVEGYPDTYVSEIAGELVPQQMVFDPALAHLTKAYRLGAPTLGDHELLMAWLETKNTLGSVLLRHIASTSLAPVLMLRGSWHLALVFGDRARDPHDLDFVAAPRCELEPTMNELLASMRASNDLIAAGFAVEELRTEDIWTYERASGRRVVSPWKAPGHVGVIQVDVTFHEDLDERPEPHSLPDGTTIQVATLRQSLIWKLLWLLTDSHPQGKDLYDAGLLLERVVVDAEFWSAVQRHVRAAQPYRRSIEPTDLAVDLVEWRWFVEEYPALAGRTDPLEIRNRLVKALEPS
jgi:hypothetical protein